MITNTLQEPRAAAARPDRAWSQLITDVEFDLASIDAEIDDLGLETQAVETVARVAEPEGDQAASLRRMMGEVGGVREEKTKGRMPVVQNHGLESPCHERNADRMATLQAARKARVVAIASGKGGVGKTNIAVNTAIALARRGLRVTLLDADLGTANADVLCGIMPSARLDHVLGPGGLAVHDGARRSINDIVVDAPGGFKLVPGSAGIGRMADLNAGERRWLVSALVELAAQADVVLIDAAAGVGQGVTSLLHAADLSIVVTTPEPTAIADAYALIKCLMMESDLPPNTEDDRIALVVNQTREPLEAFATHARIAGVCERFLGLRLPLLGFVAQDVRVGEAVRAQKPYTILDPGTMASRNTADLAVAIINMLGIERPEIAWKRLRPARQQGGQRMDRGVGGLVRRLLGYSSQTAQTVQKDENPQHRLHSSSENAEVPARRT